MGSEMCIRDRDSLVQRTLTSVERIGAKNDISVEFPFADRSYVATILGMSAWQRNRPGRPKRILRDAFADILPESYVNDPIKASFQNVPSEALSSAISGPEAWAEVRATWLEAWRKDLATIKTQ